MRIWNLTPHTMHYDDGKTQRAFPSDGLLRIEQNYQPATPIDGMVTMTAEYGELTGLPVETAAGDVLLVSTPVADCWHSDQRPENVIVLVPDTGSTCRRDEIGRIISVSRFLRK